MNRKTTKTNKIQEPACRLFFFHIRTSAGEIDKVIQLMLKWRRRFFSIMVYNSQNAETNSQWKAGPVENRGEAE
ncbi:hypothetical protein DRW41_20210 [Neobacillus piezotolerans]|uniref:Uncharacterized protein n=1 Tax=Neobacillus piezotolerans TaxID=2259171 RepID=A0A3D8GKY6_9BACI|nr:hypothetical protein DRW41_20210 [Neobacillus piezotolerans]